MKASDTIRTIKSEGELKLPITIYLLKGTYKLSEPFPEDSRNEKCPITYSAYTKQQASISGDNTSTFKHLVILQGVIKSQKYVQYVNFSGFTFSGIDDTFEDKNMPAAIDFDGTKFCSFENNCVRNIRSRALEICGDGNKITHNEIYDIGGSEIISRSFGKVPNQISFNEIHHVMLNTNDSGAIKVSDANMVIRNNYIHDSIYYVEPSI